MTTTTFTRQSQVIHRPSFRCHLRVGRKIHQLRVRTSIFTAILLDQAKKLLPLSSDREIAGIALDWQREIHCSLLI